jgi:sortase B
LKKKVMTVFIVLFAAVFAVSACMLIYNEMQYKNGKDIYTNAANIAKIPTLSTSSSEVAASGGSSQSSGGSSQSSGGEQASAAAADYSASLQKMDLAALQKVNSEVIGWITIPNTVISYPILHHSDNSYYLTHTWNRDEEIVGSIFMECKNTADFSNFNTILYGHHMNNGSMFASLKDYKDSSYWKAHPNIYITNKTGCHTYPIFAAYEVSTEGQTYQIGFPDLASRQSYLRACGIMSQISTGISPTASDHVLTLSTCTGHGHATRWIVQAVLKTSTASSK